MKNIKNTQTGSYKPLIVILLVILAATIGINYRSPISFMHIFMGLFFIVFSMFKLFDLEGFAKGFLMYDIVTKKVKNYAYVYPFIELALGMAYLSGVAPVITDLATIAVMFISAAGVVKALGENMNINCACLGTTINVPLSTVSMIENVGMGLMALISLF